VGRLQRFKEPDLAIRAMAAAVSRAPEAMADVALALVGGPSGQGAGRGEVERLEALAARLGIGPRVTFFDPQRHERLVDFYSAADVVVVPSRSESFGLVALEAQACGTPVVAAATGGLRTVVRDGESGFLVSGRRPTDYAERIIAILTNPDLHARLSRGAVRHASGFSWDATAADIQGVYGELLGSREG
jgi:D-inositol-3-phosphate glycosyltransferase